MTPKEKAKELVEAMAFSCRECDYEAKAKQCALIAVDEIIFALSFHSDTELGEEYWVEVKQEIEKI
jgi:methionine synthase II (cobalamin-independent)